MLARRGPDGAASPLRSTAIGERGRLTEAPVASGTGLGGAAPVAGPGSTALEVWLALADMVPTP
jgi:hypothetical protein